MAGLICEHNTYRYLCELCRSDNTIEAVSAAKDVAQKKADTGAAYTLETCPVCGTSKVTVKQFQNRSADEGQTLIITCNNPQCGVVTRY